MVKKKVVSKRGTQAEKFEKIVKKLLDEKSSIDISGCNFSALSFDKKAVEAIQEIANGVVENALANQKNAEVLLALSETLKASSVSIDTMLKFEGTAKASIFDSRFTATLKDDNP